MLTRRQTIAGAAGAALGATVPSATANATPALPAALPAIPADEDYAFVAWVDIDLQRYTPLARPGAFGGAVTPGTLRQTRAQYFLDAGRDGGGWRLRLEQVLVEDAVYGEDIHGPALIDVRGQTTGPDPLTRLQALLGGQMTLHPQNYVHGHALTEQEFAALKAASREVQAATIRALRDDAYRAAARFVLTASDHDLDALRAALHTRSTDGP